MNEHGSNICLSSLVIGAVAGAGVALLLASRPGSETRNRVSGSGKVREGALFARELASRAKERGRHLAEAEVEKSRGTVEGVAQEADEATSSLREYASVLDYRGL